MKEAIINIGFDTINESINKFVLDITTKNKVLYLSNLLKKVTVLLLDTNVDNTKQIKDLLTIEKVNITNNLL